MTKDEFMACTDEGDWRYLEYRNTDEWGQYTFHLEDGHLTLDLCKIQGQVLSFGGVDFVVIKGLREGGILIPYKAVERVI